MAPQQVFFLGKEVHGAALAAAEAGDLAEQFGHQQIGGNPAGQRDAVIAVGGGDVVILADGRQHPHGQRLLPHVGVEKAADFPLLVALLATLFEGADQHHQAIHFQQLRLTHVLEGRLLRRCKGIAGERFLPSIKNLRPLRGQCNPGHGTPLLALPVPGRRGYPTLRLSLTQ